MLRLPAMHIICIILVGNQPDGTVSSMTCLFESSTCFEQLCGHPQEENCVNITSGIINPNTIEWSKITAITRIHPGCIVHKTLTINYIILVI
jgi:hypothetical protein